MPQTPHCDTRTRHKGQAPIGHGRGTAAQIGAQSRAVLRPHVQPKLCGPVRAVRLNGMEQGLHLASIKEIVRANEYDAPVRQDLRLIVEDDGVCQRLHIAPVCIHRVQGA